MRSAAELVKARLPERFVLVVEGKLWRVRERHSITPGELPHLLAHLLSGGDIDPSVFQAFRLRVTIEEDTDQADDEPDGLSLR